MIHVVKRVGPITDLKSTSSVFCERAEVWCMREASTERASFSKRRCSLREKPVL